MEWNSSQLDSIEASQTQLENCWPVQCPELPVVNFARPVISTRVADVLSTLSARFKHPTLHSLANFILRLLFDLNIFGVIKGCLTRRLIRIGFDRNQTTMVLSRKGNV